MDISLSVIMPVCNEEATIADACLHLSGFLEKNCPDWEIVIVENGSTDRTYEVAAGIAARDGRIRLLRLDGKGYGRAIGYGFAHCRLEYVMCYAADQPYDISILKEAAGHLGEYDVVVGYPLGRRLPLLRKVASNTWILLINTLYRLKLRSINFPFKLFSRSFFDGKALRSTGWFIDAEVLVALKNRGARFKQIGIPYRQRQNAASKVEVRPSIVLGVLKELFFFFIDNRRPRP